MNVEVEVIVIGEEIENSEVAEVVIVAEMTEVVIVDMDKEAMITGRDLVEEEIRKTYLEATKMSQKTLKKIIQIVKKLVETKKILKEKSLIEEWVEAILMGVQEIILIVIDHVLPWEEMRLIERGPNLQINSTIDHRLLLDQGLQIRGQIDQ